MKTPIRHIDECTEKYIENSLEKIGLESTAKKVLYAGLIATAIWAASFGELLRYVAFEHPGDGTQNTSPVEQYKKGLETRVYILFPTIVLGFAATGLVMNAAEKIYAKRTLPH